MTCMLSLTLAAALAAAPACAQPSNRPAPAPDARAQASPEPRPAEFDQTHAAWTEVLRACVKDDRFDYAKLKQDPAKLDAYLAALARVTPQELGAWSREQRFAFWINAYNAFTIKKVVSHYPLKSIKDLDGALGLKSVFDDEFIALPGHHPEGKDERLSLNDIENGILRPTFKDARVHAAINCASVSCPPLLNEAFTAQKLDQQLTAQMRAFLADPRRNRYAPDQGKVELSKVFEWFEDDFKRDAGGVREYVQKYAPEEHKELVKAAKLEHLDYDWALNDVERD
jgi:hypothetical protein